MNIKRTKKAEPRIDVRYLSALGIKTYGDNNLYPQDLRDIIMSSPTGRTCVTRRATYIEGNGLTSQALADTRCNFSGDTFDDVHSVLANDCGYFDGIAIHVNYNIAGEIVSMSHIPFENCRLEEEDDNGVISHVVVHPDWRGKRTRNGRAVKVTLATIEVFPIFNPDPEVVQAQIIRAGGIEFYNGQILYVSMAGRNRYPTPQCDSVLTDMSTDEGLCNVNNRNVRNNFLAGGILWVKRGQSAPNSDDDAEQAVRKEQIANGVHDEDFSDQIDQLQGDTNACKIAVVEGEVDEDKPEFISFAPRNFDKEFTSTTGSIIPNIYAAFNQEMFYRLRSGSVGFSGELANDVKKEYCEQVTKQQRMLSRAYRDILSHWTPDDELPYHSPEDIKIEPLIKSIDDDNKSDK